MKDYDVALSLMNFLSTRSFTELSKFKLELTP